MSHPITGFHGFVGQRHIMRLLIKNLRGAKRLGQPCPHTLLHAGSGLGKTQLAEAMAAEYGTQVHRWYASSKMDAMFLAKDADQWQPYDFVFIDEIHRLSPTFQEELYMVMDKHQVPKLVEASKGRCSRVEGHRDAPAVTIIGATDRLHGVRHALAKRFVLHLTLKPYSVRELIHISRKEAAHLGLVLTSQAHVCLAKRSRGSPRVIKQHLQKLQLYFADNAGVTRTRGHVTRYLRAADIDAHGLERRDRDYLKRLNDKTGLSLRSLAVTMQLDGVYIAHHIEPYLLDRGLIEIRPQGRRLTAKGRDVLMEKVLQKRENENANG